MRCVFFRAFRGCAAPGCLQILDLSVERRDDFLNQALRVRGTGGPSPTPGGRFRDTLRVQATCKFRAGFRRLHGHRFAKPGYRYTAAPKCMPTTLIRTNRTARLEKRRKCCINRPTNAQIRPTNERAKTQRHVGTCELGHGFTRAMMPQRYIEQHAINHRRALSELRDACTHKRAP
jgi:hypothetical protein